MEQQQKKTYTKTVIARRLARIIAVQALYAVNVDGIDRDIDEILHSLLKLGAIDNTTNLDTESKRHIDEAIAIRLARGSRAEQEKLVEALQQFLAQNWKFNRLPKPIQSILLVAAYELKFTKNAASPLVINEYLEIAKLFNHESEVGFINSVLDGFCKKFV